MYFSPFSAVAVVPVSLWLFTHASNVLADGEQSHSCRVQAFASEAFMLLTA